MQPKIVTEGYCTHCKIWLRVQDNGRFPTHGRGLDFCPRAGGIPKKTRQVHHKVWSSKIQAYVPLFLDDSGKVVEGPPEKPAKKDS